MDLATFKEINANKSPTDRFCTIIRTMMFKESNSLAAVQAGNEEDKRYWEHEAKAMDDRAEWLYFGLLADLNELERRRKCSGWRKKGTRWAIRIRKSRSSLRSGGQQSPRKA